MIGLVGEGPTNYMVIKNPDANNGIFDPRGIYIPFQSVLNIRCWRIAPSNIYVNTQLPFTSTYRKSFMESDVSVNGNLFPIGRLSK